MADAVKGKDVVFYAKLGANYYPFACAKEVTITQTTDKLELAPYTTGKWRSYIYGRTSGTITGTGVVKVIADASKYGIFDLIDYQLQHQIILTKYTTTDPQGNFKTYEVPCLIDDVSFTGNVAGLATYSFSLTMSGDPEFNQTPITQPLTDVDYWDYTATGGETTISDASIIGVGLLDVRRNGIGVEFITTGTPTSSQVLYTALTGELTFGTALSAGEWILVLFLD
jgi:TP901-1 family phage major tail protein